MLYLYAISDDPSAMLPPGGLQGVDDADVSCIEHRTLKAFVSMHGKVNTLPTPNRLWQHERVVEQLMERTGVFPLRFATCFASEAALHEVLEERFEPLKEDMERVRGCVELGLRVFRVLEDRSQTANPGGDGCPPLHEAEKLDPAFQVALRANRQQQVGLRLRDESLGEVLHRQLAVHALDDQLAFEPGPATVMRSSFLVRTDHLDTIRATVRRLMDDHKHLHFLCTGPWPPYHFVTSIPGSFRPS